MGKLAHRDVQVAPPVVGGILSAVGVVLQLAVTPAGDAVDAAVAYLMAPDGRVGRGAGAAAELIAPGQAPAGRAGFRGAVVAQCNLDRFPGAAAVEREAQACRVAPVLAAGEGAAYLDRAAADPVGAEHPLIPALPGEREGIAGGQLAAAQAHRSTSLVQIGGALEVVEQVGVVGLVLAQVDVGRAGHAELGAGGLAQAEQDALAALPLGVV